MLLPNMQARMFNRRASDPKNKPDEIINALSINPGQTVVEIGAGGGYFSFRFAGGVGPTGKVYSVDSSSEFLKIIATKASEEGIHWVEPVTAAQQHLAIPDGGVDLVFLRNVYHHLSDRSEFFRQLAGKLKPEGRVAIIDYKPGSGFSFHRLSGHHTEKETIIAELQEAEYRLIEEHDLLPEQSFLVFGPTDNQSRTG